MIYRIVTGDSRGVRGVYELEAETWHIEGGTLFVDTRIEGVLTAIVTHAPGTWRSIVNAQLFEGAVKKSVGTLDENSRGRLPARPIQAV